MINAIIFNAKVECVPDEKSPNGLSLVISGNIYKDTKGRLKDGSWITTSRILGISGSVIETQNSKYEIYAGDIGDVEK